MDLAIELNHLIDYEVVYESLLAGHVDGPVVGQVVGVVPVEALDGDELEDLQFHEKIINQFEHNYCHLDIPNFELFSWFNQLCNFLMTSYRYVIIK